jgi:hypothetical protein
LFDSDDYATVYHLPGTSGWRSNLNGLPTVLWIALIQIGDTTFDARNNQFGYDITGASNLVVAVEALTNLANQVWSPLQTVTLTDGLFHFSEPLQINSSSRFYRLSPP